MGSMYRLKQGGIEGDRDKEKGAYSRIRYLMV